MATQAEENSTSGSAKIAWTGSSKSNPCCFDKYPRYLLSASLCLYENWCYRQQQVALWLAPESPKLGKAVSLSALNRIAINGCERYPFGFSQDHHNWLWIILLLQRLAADRLPQWSANTIATTYGNSNPTRSSTQYCLKSWASNWNHMLPTMSAKCLNSISTMCFNLSPQWSANRIAAGCCCSSTHELQKINYINRRRGTSISTTGGKYYYCLRLLPASPQ